MSSFYVPEMLHNKRRRSSSEEHNEMNPKAKTPKVKANTKTPNQKHTSPLDKFQIAPQSFYSKKNLDDSSSKFSSSSSHIDKDTPENLISSKIRALIASNKLVKNITNKRKVKTGKKLFWNGPKLGNKSIGHKIKPPKKRMNIPSEKPVKLIKHQTNKCEESGIHQQFDIIINNTSKYTGIKILNSKDRNTQKKLNFNDIEDVNDDDDDDDDDDDEFDSSSDELLFENEINKEEKENDTEIFGQRKFFKSRKKPIQNEFKVMGDLKITMYNGKVRVLSKTKRKKLKKKQNFSKERSIVSNILQRLSCSPEPIPSTASRLNKDDNQVSMTTAASIESLLPENQQVIIDNDASSVDTFSVLPEGDFSKFRDRIPYNTNDPEIIEQQHLLLDFLILHDICTEENFKIFIAEPDDHKEEAERIVDSLTVVVSSSIQNQDLLENIENEVQMPLYFSEEICMPENELPFDNNKEANQQVLASNETMSESSYELNNVKRITSQDINYEITKEPFNVINLEDQSAVVICNQNQKLTGYENMYTISNIEDTNTGANNIQNNEEINDINDVNKSNETPSNTDNQNIELIKDINTNTNSKIDILGNDNSTNKEKLLSNSSEKNNVQKLFPIFYLDAGIQKYKQLHLPEAITRRRNSLKAVGMNQYQIDAGQKEFGAKQCSQCGLLYTVHEPEEEKFHMEYHQSLQILKFKGWIDENVVQEYPEWGANGRIITITDKTHTKRKERLKDILEIVDKELGFSSYIFPSKFIAFLAVRHNKIVGLCLVQPLQKANKYVCVNGVDCCTEELFDVKCGISRIWVSCQHRRMGIASKLILAAQMHTIPGEKIEIHEIAFSAPTENGKAFAQKITKREDFLVYC